LQAANNGDDTFGPYDGGMRIALWIAFCAALLLLAYAVHRHKQSRR